jgi:hypothetical protein
MEYMRSRRATKALRAWEARYPGWYVVNRDTGIAVFGPGTAGDARADRVERNDLWPMGDDDVLILLEVKAT